MPRRSRRYRRSSRERSSRPREALLDELEDGWLRDQLVGLRTYAGVLAGETTLLRGRGGGLLRRSAELHGRSRLRGGARASSTSSCPATGRSRSGTSAGESSIRVPADAGRGHGRGGDRGGPRLDAQPGRPAGRRGSRRSRSFATCPGSAFCEYLGDFRSRISVNVDLPLSALELLHARDARDLSRPPRRTRLQGTTARTRPWPPRGDDRARADAAVARLRGDRRSSRRPLAARERPRAGARRDLARGRRRARPRRTALGRRSRRGAVLDWAMVNTALMLHDGGASEAEALAYLERWGAAHAGARGSRRALPARSNLPDLRDHLRGRARALPRVRRRRARPVSAAPHRAGARRATCSPRTEPPALRPTTTVESAEAAAGLRPTTDFAAAGSRDHPAKQPGCFSQARRNKESPP